MNSIWNKNLQSFKNRFPGLYKLFQKELTEITKDSFSFWEIYEAKSGQISALENSIRIHSAYNPQKEGENAVQIEEINKKSCTIFLGFGLGYHVIEWAKKYKNQNKKLILVEPEPLYFFASLFYLDWEEVFSVDKLVLAIACPTDAIISLIEDTSKVNLGTSGLSDSYIFDLQNFQNHNKDYFNIVKQLIERNKRKNEINAATLKKFGHLWINNSLGNLDQLEKRPFISCFNNIFKAEENVPFLIIAAGPSLTEVLSEIKNLKNKCIIICVETALHFLLKNNVEPDFIILTDPQYWAYKHIAGLKALNSYLVTEISTYKSVFRFPCKEIFLCSSQFHVGKYFEEKLNLNIGDLGTGGSVSSAAWNFAKYMGAKTIFTAGLDLAFPNKETHIKGSSSEQSQHKNSTRLQGPEKFNAQILYNENTRHGINYLNEDLITDSRMKMFAWWFEARLANCKDILCYSLCKNSLKIPGFEYFDLENLLKYPDIARYRERLCNINKRKAFNKQVFYELKKNFPNNTDFFERNAFLKDFFLNE